MAPVTEATDRPADEGHDLLFAETTPLSAGFNHVAVITRDLDRSAAFWCTALGTQFRALEDPRGRHGFVLLTSSGHPSVLHLFEVPEEVTGPHPSAPMMQRGRIDHLAIAASGEVALVEIRDRLVALGACDGSIRRFEGGVLSLHGTDPDGMEFEVACQHRGDVLSASDYEVVA